MNKHEGARPWDATEPSGISAPLWGEPRSCQVPSEADYLEDPAPRRQVGAQRRAQMTALRSTAPGALCMYAQMRAAARASVVHVDRHEKKRSRSVCADTASSLRGEPWLLRSHARPPGTPAASGAARPFAALSTLEERLSIIPSFLPVPLSPGPYQSL